MHFAWNGTFKKLQTFSNMLMVCSYFIFVPKGILHSKGEFILRQRGVDVMLTHSNYSTFYSFWGWWFTSFWLKWSPSATFQWAARVHVCDCQKQTPWEYHCAAQLWQVTVSPDSFTPVTCALYEAAHPTPCCVVYITTFGHCNIYMLHFTHILSAFTVAMISQHLTG